MTSKTGAGVDHPSEEFYPGVRRTVTDHLPQRDQGDIRRIFRNGETEGGLETQLFI